jgi:hypothetical protein
MGQTVAASLRIEPELHAWILNEAKREHRTVAQMTRVLIIEGRQARDTARAQQAGPPAIPGQTTIDGNP